MADDDVHLKPGELAVRLKTSPGTLANWRTRRVGPPYLKSGRSVRYRLSDVKLWELANLKQEVRS